MRRSLLVSVIALFAFGLWQEAAQAIPAFARRYRLSCKTCHSPFPRLTTYGEEFAANGFQLPDQEEPAKSYQDVGDEKLTLLRELPVAVRADLYARATPDEDVELDFQFADRLKLLSGGALHKNIAYYFYFYMSEHGEVSGVEDAYLHFNNLFGKEFDIFAGQFQVSDPLFKRELRLTFEDYEVYTLRPGASVSNLAYDRGLMLTFSPRVGTDLVFEVLNGNGKPEADESGAFDNDTFKNIFLRGSQDIVGGVRVGAFYYYGRQALDEVKNRSHLWGLDGTVEYKDRLAFNWQYLDRSDDDPFFTGAEGSEIDSRGGLLEAVYSPRGKDSDHYWVFLYNRIDSDDDSNDYNSASFHYSYLILRNLRIMGEYTRDFERDANALTGGLVAAF